MLLQMASIAATLFSIAVAIYLYIRSADRESVNRIDKARADGDAELAGKIGGLNSEFRVSAARDHDFHTRLSVLETKMLAVPTHADLVNIRTEMRELNEIVATISERSENTQSMVQSIQRYLLEHDRK
jgi:hypothetical protein